MASPFETTLHDIAAVEGWLTDEQAKRLWDRAAALTGSASIVEIGSFQGRSTIVLARAAGNETSIVAIDPHAGNDRGPQEIEGFADEAQADHERFLENLHTAGVGDRVRHLRKFSSDALDDVDGVIDLLYIDGAHRYGPALDDIRRWGQRVRPGGTMLIHDSFSSIGVTLAILRELLIGPRYRYVGRSGSLTEYRRDDLVTMAERLRNAARQATSLPWFVRNVIVKMLIVARLTPLTRLLGHRSGHWPY